MGNEKPSIKEDRQCSGQKGKTNNGQQGTACPFSATVGIFYNSVFC